MPTAELNGINLYYEDHGAGFPVVLMHGFASTSQMWRGQIDALTPRYRLITLDMRGHGDTDSPQAQEEYSEAKVVGDLSALLGRLGIEQAVIGGHSLGGYMALAFNLAHPEMVRAMMLIDTGPGYRNDQARADWNKTAVARAERFEQQGLDALGRSPEVEAVRRRHRSPAGLAKAARGMLTQVDARAIESLDSIGVPTLVVVGANDTPYLKRSRQLLHQPAA
jgi:pimeloyl-ACP methyl ester carboxylesterase